MKPASKHKAKHKATKKGAVHRAHKQPEKPILEAVFSNIQQSWKRYLLTFAIYVLIIFVLGMTLGLTVETTMTKLGIYKEFLLDDIKPSVQAGAGELTDAQQTGVIEFGAALDQAIGMIILFLVIATILYVLFKTYRDKTLFAARGRPFKTYWKVFLFSFLVTIAIFALAVLLFSKSGPQGLIIFTLLLYIIWEFALMTMQALQLGKLQRIGRAAWHYILVFTLSLILLLIFGMVGGAVMMGSLALGSILLGLLIFGLHSIRELILIELTARMAA